MADLLNLHQDRFILYSKNHTPPAKHLAKNVRAMFCMPFHLDGSPATPTVLRSKGK